jgi:hypothetical protein
MFCVVFVNWIQQAYWIRQNITMLQSICFDYFIKHRARAGLMTAALYIDNGIIFIVLLYRTWIKLTYRGIKVFIYIHLNKIVSFYMWINLIIATLNNLYINFYSLFNFVILFKALIIYIKRAPYAPFINTINRNICLLGRHAIHRILLILHDCISMFNFVSFKYNMKCEISCFIIVKKELCHDSIIILKQYFSFIIFFFFFFFFFFSSCYVCMMI